jgi:hypothetical protein
MLVVAKHELIIYLYSLDSCTHHILRKIYVLETPMKECYTSAVTMTLNKDLYLPCLQWPLNLVVGAVHHAVIDE